jgi:UDP-glucose 4-epimerase
VHILITGGAGFIGSHMADHHIARGDTVHVVDNLSTGCRNNIAHLLNSPNFRFSKADLLVWDQLQSAVEAADRIYHLAAVVGVKLVLQDPVKVMSTNMAGTERLMRAVRQGGGNPQVVVASSSEVYGFNEARAFDENSDLVLRSGGRLRWSYAVTKLADEYLAFAYARQYDLNIAIARLFNTVGPRQSGVYGMVVPTFVHQAVHHEPITIYGDGQQTRSFSDVRDTVTALDLLASCPAASGEVVNIGNEQEITIEALARLIKERAASRSELRFISYHDAYGEEFDDVSHRRPILDKLRSLTGYRAQWVLRDTIDELITLERQTIESAS